MRGAGPQPRRHGHGVARPVRRPFPSPGDWREVPIYFLMLDRFNNPAAPPNGPWNRRFDFRQGGAFRGVRAQLGTLAALGIGAIWISPVLKNAQPEGRWNYHGYGAQDFLTIDGRFASDGTSATAEIESAALVQEAHARGIRVVLDIVLNHAAEVFDYVRDGAVVADFADPAVMDAPLGAEPPVRWRDAAGNARAEWENALPAGIGPDDAVWPAELPEPPVLPPPRRQGLRHPRLARLRPRRFRHHAAICGGVRCGYAGAGGAARSTRRPPGAGPAEIRAINGWWRASTSTASASTR